MNEKNIVINNYCNSLTSMISTLVNGLAGLSDNDVINNGIIKSADINITSINSQLVILQSALDSYMG